MKEGKTPRWPRFRTAGDSGLLIEWENRIHQRINRQVQTAAEKIAGLDGIVELVPAYRTVTVYYDPRRAAYHELVEEIKERLSAGAAPKKTRPKTVEIPVCYGGEYGPDLDFVAGYHGLEPAEVVALHTKSPYHVYMLGFLPGFPYLGGLPERLATPRLDSPRMSVPAGSVGIAGNQTGIYPVASPGGWRIIGRTPLALFDPAKEPPALLSPGDQVRFVPIDEREFTQLAAGAEKAEEPVLEVLFPGLFTVVQDLGRYGYRKYGVPPAGAADRFSLRLANILAGNDENAAGLEITVSGPTLRFLRDTEIAVAGAEATVLLNGRQIPCWSAVPVKTGDVLSFSGNSENGCRTYLAVAGGIAVPKVMGSRATYPRAACGGHEGRALVAGDVLKAYPAGSRGRRKNAPGKVPPEMLPEWKQSCVLRVIPGPREDCFTARGLATLFAAEYVVGANSDRMGLRLEGPQIEHAGKAEIISEGTVPGTVQVPGDGKPIILFVDAQTVGGYPEIATVISVDLPRVGQLRPGDRVRFAPVTLQEAYALLREGEEKIKRLSTKG
ncbi:MAG: 5-oxoprolinase subunit PxpB [Bacillota bacterium]